MRTATIKIDSRLFFEFLGFKDFYGQIDAISLEDRHNQILTVKISGEDFRLPSSENYPECVVRTKVVQSYLNEVEQ